MINSVNNISFRQGPAIVPVSAHQNKPQAQPEEKSDNTKIYLALTALATLGAGALLYHKLKAKPPEVKAPHETPHAAEAESSASKVAESAEAEEEEAAKATETAAESAAKAEVAGPPEQDVQTPEPPERGWWYRTVRWWADESPSKYFTPSMPKAKYKLDADEKQEVAKSLKTALPHFNSGQEDHIIRLAEEFKAASKGDKHASVPNAIVINSNSTLKTKKAINALPAITSGKITDIQDKNMTLGELNAKIEQQKEKASELFHATGERTLLVIGDINEILAKGDNLPKKEAKEFNKSFKSFLKKIRSEDPAEMPHITMVFTCKHHSDIPIKYSLNQGGFLAASDYNYQKY